MTESSETEPTVNTRNRDIDLAAIMELYLTEWIHRDEIMWKQTFRFYIATLFIMVFPHTTVLQPAFSEEVSPFLCLIIGLIMTGVFLYISLAYGYRLKAIGNTYRHIVSEIQDAVCKREYIEDLAGKTAQKITIPSLAITIPIILACSLIAVDVLLFVIEIHRVKVALG